MNIQIRSGRRLVSGSAFLTILALFASLTPASAQTTSTIEGTVTDKQGLAVTGAQVYAECPSAPNGRRLQIPTASIACSPCRRGPTG